MCLIIAVAVFGFLCSIFWGIFAPGIFYFEGRDPDYRKKDEAETDSNKSRPKAPGWSWRIFQFWLNFACSAVGWVIAIYFIHRIQRDPWGFLFKVDDAIPLLVALLGITGLLPRILFLGKVPWKSD